MIAEKTGGSSLAQSVSMPRSLGAFLVATLIAIAPKCPLCWAAYLSLLGLSGTPLLTLSKWIMPVLIGLFLIHLSAIGKRAIQRKRFLPLILSGIGFILMISGFYAELHSLRYLGLLFVISGSITNALPSRRSQCTCSSQ